MIVLGIDPGLRVTALAVVELVPASRPELVELCSVRTRKETSDDEARRAIASEIREWLWERRGRCYDAAGIEDYVWQGPRSATHNAFRISKLVGAIEAVVLSAEQLPQPVLVSKSDCNRAIGRDGECSDALIKADLALRFGEPVGRNAHERDAVLVALAAAARHRVDALRRQRT